MSAPSRSSWRAGMIALAGLGLAAVALSIFPYPTIKSIGDTLSKDGDLASLSLARFTLLAAIGRGAGAVFIVLAGLGYRFEKTLQPFALAFGRRTASVQQALWADTRVLACHLAGAFREKKQSLPVLGLTLWGLALRWVYLARPTWHDEAYTYTVFATQSLPSLVGDYHLPNNHIFHTILVHFSTRLFGDDLWAIRLPALLAGVLLIPAGYLLAREFYNHTIALAGAGLIAAAPVLIDYSTSARGYPILTLIAVLVFTLTALLLRGSNRAAWVLWILLSALGFYTIPIMLYPFGAICVWFTASILREILPVDRARAFKQLAVLTMAVVAVGLLALLLYSPVIARSGFSSLVANSTVAPLSWSDFAQTVPHRLSETWQSWTTEVTPLIGLICLVGVVCAAILYPAISNFAVDPIITTAAWIALALLIQRPNPWAKLWTFLIPLVLIWSCAGFIGLFGRMNLPRRPFWRLSSIFCAVLLAMVVFTGSTRALRFLPERDQIGEAEAIALYLKDRLQPGEVFIAGEPEDANLGYYFSRYGVAREHYQDIKLNAFTRVYVLVHPGFEQTAQSILAERGPDSGFLNDSSLRVVQKWPANTLYAVDANIDQVERAYGVDLQVPP